MKHKLNRFGAIKASFPSNLQPMLAILVESPPLFNNWLYELKFDGYRALAFCQKNSVNLISRNNKSFNEKFYPIFNALKKMNLEVILDGEIVVLNEIGLPSFEKLQDWRSEADGELIYYVFDILWLNGYDLTQLPLVKRKILLKQIVPTDGLIQQNSVFTNSINTILQEVKNLELEGIIAKKADSIYYSGQRRHEWLKIKTQTRHEVVIGGFTKNANTPKLFSSLLVGIYEQEDLQYIGKIGTGFNQKSQSEIMEKFKPLITDKCPFSFIPDISKPSRFNPNPPKAEAIWLKPKLVCEVKYSELTKEGIMRHPSFKGMRIDKNARDVHAEIPHKTSELKKNSLFKARIKKKLERKTLLNPNEDTQVKVINNTEIKFTHLKKIFWPHESYTKCDLLNYYYQVAPYILPYLKDRPQTLNRFPNGIHGFSFYQKDITKFAPTWLKQFPYHTSLGEDKNYLIVQSEADILWMVNLGVIELNPWNSTIKKTEYPTWCIIDIDPSETNTFNQVIETAKVTKDVLEELNIKGYCKTSGASGLHIYIPMGSKYTYKQCQLLGRMIASQVNKLLPKLTSIERYSVKRPNRIYIDFLQNRPKATLAAPYSVRPKPTAPVSMPLHWDEVKRNLKPSKFTLKNAVERIKSEGDLFKPVLGKGINLKEVIKALEKFE